jgi:hypothetical protein
MGESIIFVYCSVHGNFLADPGAMQGKRAWEREKARQGTGMSREGEKDSRAWSLLRRIHGPRARCPAIGKGEKPGKRERCVFGKDA